jgi:hypothetical protein
MLSLTIAFCCKYLIEKKINEISFYCKIVYVGSKILEQIKKLEVKNMNSHMGIGQSK